MKQPVTYESQISYKGDLLEQKDLLSENYLAFFAFIMGKIHIRDAKIHIRDGNTNLARRHNKLAQSCFQYAEDFDGLPIPLKEELKKSLDSLKETNPAKNLTPIPR